MTPRIVLFAAALAALASAASAEPVNPAQAIAQKFSEASEPNVAPKKPAAVVKAPPVAKPLQVAKPFQAAKPVQVPQATQVADPPKPGADYEIEMLEEARAEKIERQKAFAVGPSAQFIRAVSTTGIENNALPAQPVVAREPEQRPAPLTAAPARTAPMPAVAEAPASASSAPKSSPAPSAQTSENKGERATVLVVLDDLGGNPGVRPDPILCFDQQCWISNGLEAPAKPMPRSNALALKTTATPMGDSCSGKSACAFRNIPIAPDAPVELVEVGESRGVGKGGYTIAADTTCRKDGDDLVCNNPLVTHEFRMWIVPEKTAQAAGPALLESAIADSLPDGDDRPDDGK
ncbi:hypothetical protein [Hyphomicrobium methylovorum]|uniref:hypothetical protein n=1 Tax=Hyphomicrobium methylovorum TaxID=84 RepID=UPI001FEC0D13|nr:hypothetical protein [Hyphomicrobium methylovorum]